MAIGAIRYWLDSSEPERTGCGIKRRGKVMEFTDEELKRMEEAANDAAFPERFRDEEELD